MGEKKSLKKVYKQQKKDTLAEDLPLRSFFAYADKSGMEVRMVYMSSTKSLRGHPFTTSMAIFTWSEVRGIIRSRIGSDLLEATRIEADNCKPSPDKEVILTMNARSRLVHACRPFPSRLDPISGRI